MQSVPVFQHIAFVAPHDLVDADAVACAAILKFPHLHSGWLSIGLLSDLFLYLTGESHLAPMAFRRTAAFADSLTTCSVWRCPRELCRLLNELSNASLPIVAESWSSPSDRIVLSVPRAYARDVLVRLRELSQTAFERDHQLYLWSRSRLRDSRSMHKSGSKK